MAISKLGFKQPMTKGLTTETVDGVELTLQELPDGQTFGYGLNAEKIFSVTDTALVSNDRTSVQEIGKITIPFDLAFRAPYFDVNITIEMDSSVTNAKLMTLFSEFRQNVENRFYRRQSGDTLKLSFRVEPTQDYQFRFSAIDENFFTYMKHADTRMFESNMGAGFVIPIWVQFESDSGDSTITDIIATANVQPTETIKTSKTSYHAHPFVPNDPWNQLLPSNLVTPSYAHTLDKTEKNPANGHMSCVAGSDLVKVSSTAGVKVGQFPLICFGNWGENPNQQPFVNSQTFEVKDELTINTLGRLQRVEEVVDSTTLRLTYPVQSSYTSPVADWATRVYFIGTFDADHASIIVGEDNNSWSESLLTGRDKHGTKAPAFGSQIQVHYCAENNPLVRVNFTETQTTSLNILDLKDYTVSTYGNKLLNGYFELPIPSTFNSEWVQSLNYDRAVMFITPCRRYAIEMFLMGEHDSPGPDENGQYSCSRFAVSSLDRYSTPYIVDRPEFSDKGHSAFTNAYGGSFAGGMIRKEEIDALQSQITGTVDSIDDDLDIAENAIQHAVSMLLSLPQIMSNDYVTTRGDQNSKAPFFASRDYVIRPEIANAGAGYQIDDVLYLDGNCLNPCRLTVTQVDSNGGVLSAFNTYTGQYYTNPSSANHTTTSNGAGTGCTINSIGYFDTFSERSSMQCVAYPASVVDPDIKNRGSGCTRMGDCFTIDPSIDLRAEFKARMLADYADSGVLEDEHSFEHYAYLWAIKKYGTIVTDVATDSFKLVDCDHRLTDLQYQRITGFRNGAMFALRATRTMLVPVHNRTPFSGLSNQKPEIKINNENIQVLKNSAFNNYGVHAYDDIEGDITSGIVVTGTVNTAVLGDYTLTHNVSDLSGNSATAKTQTISVVDEVFEPLTVFTPLQQIVEGVSVELSAAVSGGDGDYTYSWDYIGGTAQTLSDTNVLNPTVTPVYNPLLTRANYRLTVTDGSGNTERSDKDIIVLPEPTQITINIEGMPSGNYSVDFHYEDSKEYIETQTLAFSNGTATALLQLARGVEVRYTIVTNTHFAGGNGSMG